MKLLTCLGILAITYLFKRRKERAGGYGELQTSECNGSDDVEDLEDNSKHVDTAPSQHNNHESFRSYMCEQLQFDFRLAGIAGLFTIQKNLLYLAISNLDAAVFQVTYQLKILTTAIFSVVLLKKNLTGHRQVLALIVLTLGVALVQMDEVDKHSGTSYQEQRRWVGVLAVLGACCTSGFGGVYFELVLKPHSNTEETSSPPRHPCVWAKNVQLSTFALIIALITAFLKDHKAIAADGFFQGYSSLVVLVITMQACGGLIVAAVIKYADNILKSFATALSIVTSTLLSSYAFGFSISTIFIQGCCLQFIAVYLYSSKKQQQCDNAEAVTNASTPLGRQTSDIALMRTDDNEKSSMDVNVEIQEKGQLLTYRSTGGR